MDAFKNIQNLYFIGIGGIGMSALARYFHENGKNVAGYDKTKTNLTAKLIDEGIMVFYEDSVELIPDNFKDAENTLVVYTPAVPVNQSQYEFFQKENFDIKKRAVVLGMITKGIYTMAVAGTHGKTTTTAILAHLLKECGAKVTAFLGGISEDIQSNLILKGNEVMVVEADEFDRSFLNLSPNIAAITSMDADHLDIYGDAQSLRDAFKSFSELVPKDGFLFIKNGLPLKGITIGIEDNADYSAQNLQVIDGEYHFDLHTPTNVIRELTCSLPGKHNLHNALTALVMAIHYNIPSVGLAQALKSFKGVKRRFSYKIKTDDLVLIDDYAHHPAEIAAVQQAVREMHPYKKVLAVFQPHLYSRTRDFGDEFAVSLSAFDEVILLDIYPARETPIPGITSKWLLEKIKNEKKHLVAKKDLTRIIKDLDYPVVVMMGAGDIGEEVSNVQLELLQ